MERPEAEVRSRKNGGWKGAPAGAPAVGRGGLKPIYVGYLALRPSASRSGRILQMQ